jgi:hypothetical protein
VSTAEGTDGVCVFMVTSQEYYDHLIYSLTLV